MVQLNMLLGNQFKASEIVPYALPLTAWLIGAFRRLYTCNIGLWR